MLVSNLDAMRLRERRTGEQLLKILDSVLVLWKQPAKFTRVLAWTLLSVPQHFLPGRTIERNITKTPHHCTFYFLYITSWFILKYKKINEFVMTISGTVSEHALQGAMNVIMLILIGNNWDNLFLINRCLILSEQSSLNMQTLSKGKDSFWYFTNFCNQTFFSNIHIFYPLLFQD